MYNVHLLFPTPTLLATGNMKADFNNDVSQETFCLCDFADTLHGAGEFASLRKK